MKKFLPLFLLIFGSVHAQIVLENVYPGGSGKQLGIIHLTSSGYKYMEADTDQIFIFNLNHSVFKTINIPQQTNVNQYVWQVSYVSEELFNTNPNDVEYMLFFQDLNGNAYHIRIYDENGNLLFGRDSVTAGAILGPGYQQSGIAYTPNGVKLILNQQNINGAAEVYSLPGVLPCTECTSNVMSGLAQSQTGNGNPQEYLSDPFPNPTNNTCTVGYKLPSGTNTGTLIFYNVIGEEVRRFTVTNSFTNILISSGDLGAGVYHYNLVTSEGIIAGKEIIVTE